MEIQLQFFCLVVFGMALMGSARCDDRVREVRGCDSMRTVIFSSRRECKCPNHGVPRDQEQAEQVWVRQYSGQYIVSATHVFTVTYPDSQGFAAPATQLAGGEMIIEPDRDFNILLPACHQDEVRVELQCIGE